jgi:hypothetical protein
VGSGGSGVGMGGTGEGDVRNPVWLLHLDTALLPEAAMTSSSPRRPDVAAAVPRPCGSCVPWRRHGPISAPLFPALASAGHQAPVGVICPLLGSRCRYQFPTQSCPSRADGLTRGKTDDWHRTPYEEQVAVLGLQDGSGYREAIACTDTANHTRSDLSGAPWSSPLLLRHRFRSLAHYSFPAAHRRQQALNA